MIYDNINNTKCNIKLFNKLYSGFKEEYLREKAITIRLHHLHKLLLCFSHHRNHVMHQCA